MLIQIASDLHLEFFYDRGKGLISTLDPTGVDALVLAGDIFVAKDRDTVRWTFEEFKKKYENVIFVPGNHCYYHGDLEVIHNRLKFGATDTGVYMLEPGKTLLLQGQRFIGATMWFPFNPMNGVYSAGMPDFHVINGFVPRVYKWNEETLAWFEKATQPGDVVITHHLPSYKSVPEKYKGSSLNHFFVCPVDRLIHRTKPKLWIHGHTHTVCDYTIGSTRIVANPRGYPGSKEIQAWNPKLTIEV